jgi:hypothetical protein
MFTCRIVYGQQLLYARTVYPVLEDKAVENKAVEVREVEAKKIWELIFVYL